ncbi:MAG TPA: hypothetical protein VFM71_01465, partial [Gemmatimonadaceae bacterium]|nr:hypothetical protein [Gemmatimonadaceae bacterium]
LRVRGFASVPVLDVLDFSTGWTDSNTPTRVAASYSGSGADGVPLDLIGDDDAASTERYFRIVTFTGDAAKAMSFRAKQGSSATSSVEMYDSTAAAVRLRVTITWTAGVPSTAFSVGSLISSTLIGDGVYRFVVLTTPVTAANSNRIYAEPSAFTVAATGTTYMGDFLAWDAATDQLVYDTGYESALPANTDAEDREGVNVPWVHVTDEDETARYWRVNINDTTNADGYVDLSRLVIAGGVQPSFNMNYGARLGYEDDTVRTLTDGGAAVYDERDTRRRTVTFRVDGLPEAEAYSGFGGLSRRGIARQVMFVYDPDDTTLLWQRSFLATLREPSEFESAILARAHTTVTLTEEI